jgi:hypothetical protein
MIQGAGIPKTMAMMATTLPPIPYPKFPKSAGTNKGNMHATTDRIKAQAADAEAE